MQLWATNLENSWSCTCPWRQCGHAIRKFLKREEDLWYAQISEYVSELLDRMFHFWIAYYTRTGFWFILALLCSRVLMSRAPWQLSLCLCWSGKDRGYPRGQETVMCLQIPQCPQSSRNAEWSPEPATETQKHNFSLATFFGGEYGIRKRLMAIQQWLSLVSKHLLTKWSSGACNHCEIIV